MAAAALSGGCSVLFHADASQCSTDSDCRDRGALFEGYTCSLGTCIPPVIPNLEGGPSDGGMLAQACTKNSDCLEAGMDPCHSNVACNVDNGQCLQLTTPECGFVIGDYCGTEDQPSPTYPPIFLGAFAVFPTMTPLSDPSYLNYELAVDEFQGYTPGLPVGPAMNGNRTPVVVACDVQATSLVPAMQHLIGDLGVPAIVAPIEPLSQLATIFATYCLPGNNPFDGGAGYGGTLMINPFGADSTLTNQTTFPTDGLLYHMLGQPTDVVPAYAAFLPLVENYVRTHIQDLPDGGTLGPTAPMKIATVWAPNQLLTDLGNGVTGILTWNGGQSTAADAGPPPAPDAGACPCQSDSNYCALQLNDSTLNGATASTIDYMSVASCLLDYGPQVIISFASEEFIYVLDEIESQPNMRPFYLLSPYNDQDLLLASIVQESPPLAVDRDQRLAGIDFASALDPTVLDAYQTRLINLPGGTGTMALGQENYYDAMYFAIYALATVGRKVVTGPELITGFPNLIGQSPPLPASQVQDVGPGTQMGTIFSDIDNGETISLVGTLGPPNFNPVTGSRISQGDVYCLSYADGGGVSYDVDVLRLANVDGGPAPDGGGALTGTFPCYPGIQ
ncbi:MAG TPA: hypothetical protein VEK07_07390 [Polyangiaceae bacterium]|nr:hypothetical protein [Polyangiaceae bacterium]